MIIHTLDDSLGHKISRYEQDNNICSYPLSPQLKPQIRKAELLRRENGRKLINYITRLYLDYVGDLVRLDYAKSYRYKRWSNSNYGCKDWYHIEIPAKSNSLGVYHLFKEAARKYYVTKTGLREISIITTIPCACIRFDKPPEHWLHSQFEYKEAIHTIEGVAAFVIYVSSNISTKGKSFKYLLVRPDHLEGAMDKLMEV